MQSRNTFALNYRFLLKKKYATLELSHSYILLGTHTRKYIIHLSIVSQFYIDHGIMVQCLVGVAFIYGKIHKA